MNPTRRNLLIGGAAASVMLQGASMSVRAAETDQRFVLILLRGAMDGLNVVVPYGDRDLYGWRPALMPPEPGREKGLQDLGGFWGLHPALQAVHVLYGSNQALPVHCVAGPNRSRSHFEAQDMMEIGADHRLSSGWMNRLAGQLPANPNCDVAFTMNGHLPLVLLGAASVTTWDPFQRRPHVSPGFYENVAAMYGQDGLAGKQVADALKERRYIDGVMAGLTYDGIPNGFPRLAHATARLLAARDGPRLAELELDGWDTHSGQVPRLAEALRNLDLGIGLLRAGLADVWPKTTILVMTEFGRTVRANGTGGTDHGTATVAFVLGGQVAGGRVMANWPGLARGQLFEDRDLQPTMDVRAVAKGLIEPVFGLTAAQTAQVFPDSDTVAPAKGLLRA